MWLNYLTKVTLYFISCSCSFSGCMEIGLKNVYIDSSEVDSLAL